MPAPQLGIVGTILSSCIVKETLAQVVVGSGQQFRTIRDAALDISQAIDSRSARWSAQIKNDSGVLSFNLDMTALPLSQPTDAGVTTFDATALRVLWWRIRNKHATNWLGIDATVVNAYPLFGTGWMGTNKLPVSPGGFRDGFDVSNLPLVDATHKIVTLAAYTAGGSSAVGVDCEVSLLLDSALNATP